MPVWGASFPCCLPFLLAIGIILPLLLQSSLIPDERGFIKTSYLGVGVPRFLSLYIFRLWVFISVPSISGRNFSDDFFLFKALLYVIYLHLCLLDFIFIYVYMLLYVISVWVTMKAIGRCWIPWNWSYGHEIPYVDAGI